MTVSNWNEVLNKIRGELSNLAKFVDNTRRGLDTLESTVQVSSEKFPEASNQLSAVTGDLENAANNIMSILEGLMAEEDRANILLNELKKWAEGIEGNAKGVEVIKELASINEKSKKDMMDIFTNLSFQDLTGQKLKKVINSLATVEKKLLDLALSFGFSTEAARAANTKVPDNDGLKGPMNTMPIDQDLVDKIMKELGT